MNKIGKKRKSKKFPKNKYTVFGRKTAPKPRKLSSHNTLKGARTSRKRYKAKGFKTILFYPAGKKRIAE